ncbi:MAG: hypothetical protein AB2796_13620 [Candidatus Thiodiazotropha sp.]
MEFSDTLDPGHLESALRDVQLYASRPSKIVFNIPASVERIDLDAESILNWDQFYFDHEINPRYPDFETIDHARRKLLGIDWWNEGKSRFKTTIELPWGVILQPIELVAQDYRWRHVASAIHDNAPKELWYTSLENRAGRHIPVPLEVLDVQGLKQLSDSDSELRVHDVSAYDNRLDFSASTNFDRLELLSSLSRRFPYFPIKKQKAIKYFDRDSQSLIADLRSCYVTGRSVEAFRFGLSALGGFLDLEGKWDAENGCAMQAWTHKVHLGRDQEVKYERKGWLYPLGVPAVLIVLSTREYIKDIDGHYVAPLVKRAFIRVPQPNELTLEHRETPFNVLSVTTESTPALDVPEGGNSSDYARCMYFLPTVDQREFEFELRGEDHEGNLLTSKMACYFVSNRALDENGLIREPCYKLHPGLNPAPPPPLYVCSARPKPGVRLDCKTDFGVEGLWELDREWMSQSFRFAQLNLQKVAVAPSTASGNTIHEVEWIEWVRGQQPALERTPDDVGENPRPPSAQSPFLPRARTMKLALPSVRTFSGQDSFVLTTYRNLRSSTYPVLDPFPTDVASYHDNVLNALDSENQSGSYLQVLQIQDSKDRQVSTQKVADAYYKGLSLEIQKKLLGNLDNIVRFGRTKNTEASGGLATPDTPVGLLSLEYGVLGDALMDPMQIDGVPSSRLRMLDHWRKLRPGHLYDGAPLCAANSIGANRIGSAMLAANEFGSIASMFGLDAEILPGIRLTKVLAASGIDFGQLEANVAPGNAAKKTAPLQWNYKITGVDEFLNLIGEGPDQISVGEFFSNLPETIETGEPLAIGIEAGLLWSSRELGNVDLGIIKFIASTRRKGRSTFSVQATTKSSLVPKSDFSIEADARLDSFGLEVLSSILVDFDYVNYKIQSNRDKKFRPAIDGVDFFGPLSFVSNLKDLLSSLEEALGLTIDLTPERVEVGQVIAIPPSATGGKSRPFYVGPALIENLAIRWGMILPLVGRSPMLFYFGLATREEPFTISIFPYGGQSHALIESTVRGVRLFEISMAWGGVAGVTFAIASGQVSLTAGMFFSIARSARGRVTTFAAFVKMAGSLDVAGIITFSGLIQVTLGYTTGGDGSEVRGTAIVRVSVKWGFVRLSFEFAAEHVEKQGNGASFAPQIYALNAADDVSRIGGVEVQKSAAYRPFDLISDEEWKQFVEGYV